MRKQGKYWDKILTQYQESGLTRPAFCKQHDLSYSQFQYQWYKHQPAGRVATKRRVNQLQAPLFESISITTPSVESIPSDTPVELVICLPNQVRCEIRCGMKPSELPALLKQLVAIC